MNIKILFIGIFFFSVIFQQIHAQSDSRPKVGVVLSGGGAKGLAHIGVLQVLEDKGIPIDYICGSSMGGMVGGLYACGYSPDAIEQLMLNVDWKSLLSDKMQRNYIAFDERDDFNKYIVGLRFDKSFKPVLPGGLIKGQNLSLFLNEIFAPSIGIYDFSKLKTPFFCIGSDLIKVKDVILDHGYLPEVIRASAAIPTVFSPVRIDDMLLIDGGFFNNFPAKELKEKGIDIIIGVNVGFEKYDTKSLQSMVEVTSQLLWINNVEKNEESKKYCNILIEPNMQNSSALSFNKIKDIINIGRIAANNVSEKLDSVATFLKSFNSESINTQELPPSTPVTISSFELSGIKKTSEKIFLNRMMIPFYQPVDITVINNGIERNAGSLNYENITYKIIPADSTHKLFIHVVENKPISLKIGFGYDSDLKAALRFKITTRNLFLNSTKFSLKASISRFPVIQAKYAYFPESKSASFFSVGVKANLQYFQIFDYNKERSKINESQIVLNNYGLYYQYYFKQNFLFEIELNNTFAWNHDIIVSDIKKVNEMILELNTKLLQDTYNDDNYPTKGSYISTDIYCNYPYHTSLIPINAGIFGNYSFCVKIHKNIYFYPQLEVSLNLADTISNSQRNFVGGMNEFSSLHSIKFAGYGSAEIRTANAVVANLDLRINIAKNHHVLLKSSFGAFSNSITNYHSHIYKAGVGLGYSFNSYIGPLEIIISNSILERGSPKLWLALGHKF